MSPCLVLACTLTLPAILFAGCKKEAAPEAAVSVQAAHPERGPIAEHVVAEAILAPVAQAAIDPKITAPVKKFYVQRGSKVTKGELLAVLENGDLTAAALDNKGAYMAAQGAYATATRSQIPEEVQTAKVAVDQAKATLDLDKSIVESRTKLFAEGAVPGQDLDSAKATLVQAQGAYETAEKHLEAVRSVNRAAALEEAQGQLTSAKGKYDGAQAEVGYSEIRSPIDGVVTERPLFAGETASAGTPLLTVMDTTTLIAKAHIAQSLAQELKVSNDAVITVPGMTDSVPAKVSMISPALDPGSTTIEVWLKVGNRNGALKAGTPVKATIIGRSVPDALKLPASAIQTAPDESKFVLVVGSDGTAQKRPVTLGIVNADEAQITGGITAQDMVITVGAYGLDEGTKVKVERTDLPTPGAGVGGGGN
ncbi:MAG: efflux RND transporter periplasmic adaptor subunit [Terracidiphilus sp.]